MKRPYKVLPEIKEFIIKYKEENPRVSCRKLTAVLKEKFQAKISKSSINAIIKEAGLSDRIGRKSFKKRPALEKKGSVQLQLKYKPETEPKPEIKLQPPVPEETQPAQEIPVQAPEEIRLPPPPEELGPQEEIKPPEEIQAQEETTPAEETKPLKEEHPVPEEIQPQPPEEVGPTEEKEPEEEIKLPEEAKAQEETTPTEETAPLEITPQTPPKFQPEPVRAKRAKQSDEAKFYIFKAADLALGGLGYILQLYQLPAENEDELVEFYLELANSVFNKDIESHNKYPEATLLGNVSRGLSLISRQLPMKLQEVYAFKVSLTNNMFFYIDAQFNSLWATTNIPYEFYANIDWTKHELINRLKNKGIILLTAPQDLSQLDNLFNWMQMPAKNIEFLGEGNRVLSTFDDVELNRKKFIFGLLPHQFQRQIHPIRNLSQTTFALGPLNEEFELSDSEIELDITRKIKLRMITIKKAGDPRPSLTLLSNFYQEEANPQEIATKYLESWPDPLFAFDDFERKNELLAYDIKRRFPSYPAHPALDWENILDFWNKSLHIYCIRHIFPFNYEKYDFAQIKERFYDLKVETEVNSDYYIVRFLLPGNYIFKKDLEYLVKRVNQKCLFDLGNRRLWFSLA